MFFTFLFSFDLSAEAQNAGYLVGKVTEVGTGVSLPGANIWIIGTTIGSITDIDGKFILNGLAPGVYTIGSSFLGYEQDDSTFTIKPGKNELNFELSPLSFTGEAVVVVGMIRGQQKAINQQINSDALVSVVSEDRLKELPDNNAAEAIGRLPGVSIKRDGGEGQKVTIRGIEPKFNNITINGMKLPSSAAGDRSTNIGMISAEMLSGIEVYKMPTPDMDAEALGGTVNLKMKKADKGFRGVVKASQITNGLTKSLDNYKASLQLSNRFLDNKLGVIGQLDAQKIDRSTNTINTAMVYTTWSESNPQFENRKLIMEVRNQNRQRYGGSLHADYKHKYGDISLFSMANVSLTNTFKQTVDYNDTPQITYAVNGGERQTSITNNSLTGTLNFPLFSVDYGSSFATINGKNKFDYNINFDGTSADNVLNNSDSLWTDYPHLIQDNIYLSSYDSLRLKSATFDDKPLNDKLATANIDIKVPLNFRNIDKLSGFLKIGTRFKSSIRSSETNITNAYDIYYNFETNRALADHFESVYGDALLVDGKQFVMGNMYDRNNITYQEIGDSDLPGIVEPLLDESRMEDFVKAAKPHGYYDVLQNIRDYEANEKVFGHYFMLNLDIGKMLNIITGLRYEHSNNKYVGVYSTMQGPLNSPTGSYKDTTNTVKNNFLLPHLHIRFKPVDWFDLRFSNARTLSRPDYYLLLPRTYFNTTEGEIEAGNSNIKPTQSNNFDITASLYSSKYGMLRAGVFLKEIENPIYNPTNNIFLYNDSITNMYNLDPKYTGWILKTNINSKTDARVWGYEAEIQTSLKYLPKPFDGIVLSVNFTKLLFDWAVPIIDVRDTIVGFDPRGNPITEQIIEESARATSLPSLIPLIVNGMIGYDYKGFTCRLSINYQDRYKTNVSSKIPETDKYRASQLRFDFSVSQKINKNFSVHLNLANLTSERELDYIYQYTPNRIRKNYNYGMTAEVGIKATF